MILAIDVGNTHIVLGCIEAGRILNTVRIRTDPLETNAEYAMKLKEVMEIYEIDPNGFEGAIISSVVPPVTDSLAKAVKKLTGRDCIIVGTGMDTGISVCIDDPDTLAPDILVGSVAAVENYSAPAIIMDLGTATTIVAVDGERRYRGGAILPGVKLSYRALAAGTSLLPDISIVPPGRVIGTNTVDAMRSGAVYSTAAALDGMIERMEAELGAPCAVIATGGLAKDITPHCRHDIVCDDDLLLKGLWCLFEKNRPQ